jgi:hypothetical protein
VERCSPGEGRDHVNILEDSQEDPVEPLQEGAVARKEFSEPEQKKNRLGPRK